MGAQLHSSLRVRNEDPSVFTLLPVVIPGFEFGRSESVTRDVAFMQAA